VRQARFFGGDCRERRDDAGARNPRRCVGRTLLVKACARTTAGSHISRERERERGYICECGRAWWWGSACVCVCVSPPNGAAHHVTMCVSRCVWRM